MFGKAPEGYLPQHLADNLYGMNIEPDLALHEYAMRKVKLETVYRMVFENDAVKKLLHMVPGMTELLVLGKAFDLERERNRQGTPKWDLVIVDAPATGHGMSLLRLPDAILEVVDQGPMAQEVREMRTLLEDSTRTCLHIVTLPEEMPVRETFDLLEQLEEYVRVPKGFLFINGVWPKEFGDKELQLIDSLDPHAPDVDPLFTHTLACLKAQNRRRAFQERYLQELHAHSKMPCIEIPQLFVEEMQTESMIYLSELIGKESERLEDASGA